jgi:hypothetical protein
MTTLRSPIQSTFDRLLTGLLTAQLPAWTSAVFTAAGMVLMALYHHLLERRSKRLDHQLQKETIVFEKQLAFMQDRHTKRLDALDALGRLLMEFNHGVRHVADGDIGYSSDLQEYFAKSRSLGRETEPLLGPDVYKAIIAWTDAGRAILDASFVVTDRAVAIAKAHGLRPDLLEQLQSGVGTKHPVREGGASIFRDYDEELRSTYRRLILGRCDFSDCYNENAYDKVSYQFSKLRDEITRTLPVPPT